MSWGTTVQVYLSRITPDEMESKIEDADHLIRWARDKLLMLAAATPRSVPDIEGNPTTWEEYIHGEIGEIMDILEEDIPARFVCQQAVEWPGAIVTEEEDPPLVTSSMDEEYSKAEVIPSKEAVEGKE